MSPVAAALQSVSRAISSYHPSTMPLMSRSHYRRELVVWSLLPIMLGAVEGGVTGVLAKHIFAGVVDPRGLNLAVAVLTGAPAFANVTSFVWAGLSHGRHKIRFLFWLQVATVALVAGVALAPRSGLGLLLLIACAAGARTCWAGVITLRSTVWRANYPRTARATMAGKLAAVQAIVMSGTGVLIGLATEIDQDAFRFIYPAAAVLSLAGAWRYRRMRVRRHRALLAAELDGGGSRERMHPGRLVNVLREDGRFRRYLTCMWIFGTGNIMMGAPLVIMLRDRFDLQPFASMLIAASIATLLIPVAVPFWSRLLDRMHVVQFRVIHSWAFVATVGFFAAACILKIPALLWVGAVCKGIAFGGGVLAWNLGHHDFAPADRASEYMGVHVTLTGLRGVVAPTIGVSIYQILEHFGGPGAGAWVMLLALSLSMTGPIGFLLIRRELRGAGHDATFEDGPPIQPTST